MLKSYDLATLDEAAKARLCKRTAVNFEKIMPVVQEIILDVKARRDAAVSELTKKFDADFDGPIVIPVPPVSDIDLDAETKQAFETAFNNIQMFHMAQQPRRIEVETMPGVSCIREARPIESVGLYVPGGTAVLPSSVLMLGVPAMIAGCPVRVMATPPRKDGSIAPEILYCAALTGITHIVKAGGAQAIAAMAYGTETIPKVNKIFGPGNQYVTCAKMMLSQSDALVGIDMPAGPSEVLVIADETADPDFIAADLLSQAEHGADSQVLFITTSSDILERTKKSLEEQLSTLPRAEIARLALANSSALLVKTMEEAIGFSNEWAPEHLIISSDNAKEYVSLILNAGSVFLGNYTPESVGDYASGTNHTLPTSGYAAMYSGVSLDSFFKLITFQHLSPEGLKELGPTVEIMAASEGLEAHKQAVSIRLSKLSS
ncbi:MAG: histidinol dehydrogenase [Balneolales bacterium]|nr:histidinol dehydrogenase [Balneolales bacterium]